MKPKKKLKRVVLGEGYPDLKDFIWMNKRLNFSYLVGFRARVPRVLNGKKIRLIAEVIE